MKRFLGCLPILAGLLALFVVAGIGIALTVPGAASDPNANPAQTVGYIALAVSVVVFLGTRYFVKNAQSKQE